MAAGKVLRRQSVFAQLPRLIPHLARVGSLFFIPYPATFAAVGANEVFRIVLKILAKERRLHRY